MQWKENLQNYSKNMKLTVDKPYFGLYNSNIIKREREFDMYKKGDKIIGVFGAMFPIEEGEIISIDYDTKLDGAYAVDVMFHEDGAVKKIMSSEIDDAVGKLSPIGYYTEEAYYG